MKIRDMDIYFTVPVDRAVLAACRKAAGYVTDNAFQDELKRRGYPFGYVRIERRPAKIRGDMAGLIAEVMGMPPEAVFPAFSASRAAAIQNAEDNYYKPFTTVQGRNAAIVAAMEPVKWTALKYSNLLNDQYSVYRIEADEVISIAFETLVYMADRAMKKGIHIGTTFDAAACVAVKQEFLRRGKEAGSITRKADVCSYEDFEECPAPYDFVEEIILREEVLQAVRDMPEEKKKDKRIKTLLEELGG